MSKRIKWLSLLLAVGMIASLAACGGDSAGGSSTPPASTAPSESEAPPAETESAPEEAFYLISGHSKTVIDEGKGFVVRVDNNVDFRLIIGWKGIFAHHFQLL